MSPAMQLTSTIRNDDTGPVLLRTEFDLPEVLLIPNYFTTPSYESHAFCKHCGNQTAPAMMVYERLHVTRFYWARGINHGDLLFKSSALVFRGLCDAITTAPSQSRHV